MQLMGSNSNIQPRSGTQPFWKHLTDARFQETAHGTQAMRLI